VADYTSIRDAALSVRQLLMEHITNSGELGIDGVPVELSSPRELEVAAANNVVSLWLHRVHVQPDMVNRLPERRGPDLIVHRPVPLELCFHITPIHQDAGTQLLLLGRAVQVIYDHRRLAMTDLVGSLTNSAAELLLTIDPLAAYELNLIWGSLHTHQRSGFGMRMTGLAIDSHLPLESAIPVVTRQATVSELVGAP
jgi:hypothetical protein